MSGLPGMDDLVIDVGGYRFPETDLLPAELVWNKLKLPTSLYGNCESPDTECYKIADVYGNNAGYTMPIEDMLGELMTKGTQVYWGFLLKAVRAPDNGETNVTSVLEFEDLSSSTATPSIVEVSSESVLLNIPGNAMNALAPDSIIFQDSTPRTKNKLCNINTVLMVKVYANYENAWWYNDLGLMNGRFTDEKVVAPLHGRYHDGPTKCIVGYGADGSPIYSKTPIAFGNCTGAILVSYTQFLHQAYYTSLMTSPSNPLTVITSDSANAEVLDEVHASLMSYHMSMFEEAGIDPSTIDKPKGVFIGNWINEAPLTPGIGYYPLYQKPANEASAAVRKPSANHSVYVANHDYGFETGWASSALLMSEKILQSEPEFGFPKPAWLDEDYYQKEVVNQP